MFLIKFDVSSWTLTRYLPGIRVSVEISSLSLQKDFYKDDTTTFYQTFEDEIHQNLPRSLFNLLTFERYFYWVKSESIIDVQSIVFSPHKECEFFPLVKRKVY